MTQAYHFNGLKLESDFHLPALAPWDGPPHARSDVVVRQAAAPLRLDCPDHIGPVFQTKGTSEYLLALPGTGRILVRNGDEVLVDAEPGADTSAILSGPVQAMLWHQRGLLPLHGSVVVVGTQAIALCGPSAAGKSTLAAMLAEQGHAVVADDVCVIDPDTADVLAGCGRLRLWRDALDRLGIETRALERAAQGKEKYVFDCGLRSAQERHRLAAVVLLVRQNSGAVRIERLRGVRTAAALKAVVHMRRPADALERGPNMFAALTRLVAGGVTVWRLHVAQGAAGLHEAAKLTLGVLEA
jgi:hypothetical protein